MHAAAADSSSATRSAAVSWSTGSRPTPYTKEQQPSPKAKGMQHRLGGAQGRTSQHAGQPCLCGGRQEEVLLPLVQVKGEAQRERLAVLVAHKADPQGVVELQLFVLL